MLGDTFISDDESLVKNSDTTARLAMPSPTKGFVQPVAQPGPVFTSVAVPPVSDILEGLSNDAHDLQMVSTLINFIDRPPARLPLSNSVTINEAATLDNFHAIILGSNSESTLITMPHHIDDQPGPVIISVVSDAFPKYKNPNTRDVPATTTADTHPPTTLINFPRATINPHPPRTGVSPATIGWIVAAVFACVMTCVCIYLVKRTFTQRQRQIKASRSGGIELTRASQSTRRNGT